MNTTSAATNDMRRFAEMEKRNTEEEGYSLKERQIMMMNQKSMTNIWPILSLIALELPSDPQQINSILI